MHVMCTCNTEKTPEKAPEAPQEAPEKRQKRQDKRQKKGQKSARGGNSTHDFTPVSIRMYQLSYDMSLLTFGLLVVFILNIFW